MAFDAGVAWYPSARTVLRDAFHSRQTIDRFKGIPLAQRWQASYLTGLRIYRSVKVCCSSPFERTAVRLIWTMTWVRQDAPAWICSVGLQSRE